jgi:DtxR family Mn-dependent transcriptional regulator
MKPDPSSASHQITASLEDYLEAIRALIAGHGHAHTRDIAMRLGITMPSVSRALQILARQGHIQYRKNYPIVLTPSGERIAEEVQRRHSFLEAFFRDQLGLDRQKASDTACKIEHIVDSDTMARWETFVGSLPPPSASEA